MENTSTSPTEALSLCHRGLIRYLAIHSNTHCQTHLHSLASDKRSGRQSHQSARQQMPGDLLAVIKFASTSHGAFNAAEDRLCGVVLGTAASMNLCSHGFRGPRCAPPKCSGQTEHGD